MQVILLQQVRNLGDIGDQVRVRAGYGRNFLIPQGVALMATKANIAVFEQRKAEFLEAARERKAQAQGRVEKVPASITVPMRASDEGKLYGSVGPHEIADALGEVGFEADAGEVILAEGSIRLIGYYQATLSLHAEVEAEIQVIVAQRTDMGVNMPPAPGSDEDEAVKAASQDEQAEDPAAVAEGEQADTEATVSGSDEAS